MATFTKITRRDGSTAFKAQITRTPPSGKRYTETRTIDKLQAAKAWAKQREAELDKDIEAGKPPKKRREKRVTLGDAIDKYVAESREEIGKTKAQVLRTIGSEYHIADMACTDITSKDVVDFVKELHNRPGLDSTATANNYLSHLASVFDIARPAWGFPLEVEAMSDAKKVCKRLGLTGKPISRDRRPTVEELDVLLSHFEQQTKDNPRCMPMHVITLFALFSTRRQEEICRIAWDDYHDTEKRVIVRDMKHPGQKKGNDRVVELPDPCTAIIDRMPRREERIFPYNSDTVSRRFTDACKVLGIEDLRFHDLRHEGTSRLAEIGRTVPQLAAVTGHKSWSSLERYTHVRQIGDKYDGWEWIKRVVER